MAARVTTVVVIMAVQIITAEPATVMVSSPQSAAASSSRADIGSTMADTVISAVDTDIPMAATGTLAGDIMAAVMAISVAVTGGGIEADIATDNRSVETFARLLRGTLIALKICENTHLLRVNSAFSQILALFPYRS
jgi:citrate lyase synthetase